MKKPYIKIIEILNEMSKCNIHKAGECLGFKNKKCGECKHYFEPVKTVSRSYFEAKSSAS